MRPLTAFYMYLMAPVAIAWIVYDASRLHVHIHIEWIYDYKLPNTLHVCYALFPVLVCLCVCDG